MYEEVTFESVLKRMLERIPESIDKREGSIIWDALAPAAVEMQQMYIELDVILQETFADTASKEYLVKRAAERGLSLKEATYATLKGVFNINVPINSRFSVDDKFYTVSEKISEGVFQLVCETAGAIGNKSFGKLIPLEYIDKLTSAELTELLIPGEEEETEEELRSRYYKSVSASAFGGNIADYKKWAGDIQGIGGAKIYPAWKGGGTVGIVIITSEFKSPSEELVNLVQEILDPVDYHGQGLGVAPIGHNVSVEGVKNVFIKIETSVSYLNGWDYDKTKDNINNAIEDYLNGLCKVWEGELRITVRVSQIEARLLNIQGIVDIQGTKINDLLENLVLDKDEIPVRGDVIVNESECGTIPS